MMNPIYKLIGLVIFLFAILLTFNFVMDGNPLLPEKISSGYDDDDDDIDDAPAGTSRGQAAVYMDQETQQQANIRTITLESVQHQNEIHAYARVLDIQQLLDWWSGYRSVNTEISMAQAAVQISRQEFERLKLLHNEASNISERQLQQARLQWVNDQNTLDAARNRLRDIQIRLLQDWGTAFAEKFMNDEDFARQLLERKSLLLLVIVEGGMELPDNTDKILINEQDGNRAQAMEAYYLSPATTPDQRIFGKTYLFHTPHGSLRTGIYLDAWIPENSETTTGVYIPPEAVIWYADKPWVYVKTDNQTFKRRDIDQYKVTRSGWYVQHGFNEGEQLVVHGAQMLLSEEFRWSIPDEDDDP